MVVQTFLIVAVAALHLSIMLWRAWTDLLVLDPILLAHGFKRMLSFCLGYMTELRSIVGLYDLWTVSEVSERTFYKIYR